MVRVIQETNAVAFETKVNQAIEELRRTHSTISKQMWVTPMHVAAAGGGESMYKEFKQGEVILTAIIEGS